MSVQTRSTKRSRPGAGESPENGEDITIPELEASTMASCPHCNHSLELAIEEQVAVPVHRDGSETLTHPDVFACSSCESVLFATVSRELSEK